MPVVQIAGAAMLNLMLKSLKPMGFGFRDL